MKSLRAKNLLLAIGLTVMVGLPPGLLAETETNATAATQKTPPSLPVAKCPVDYFRELLAMNLAERKQALTNRSPESRRQIFMKLRQYEALKPAEQKLRLKVTELRWYLFPLLRAPATNRQEQLAAIPVETRQLVEDRLQLWDMVPSELQKELLDNE